MCVENRFIHKLIKAFNIIKESGINYERFGVFGSFARNNFNSNSDIDFVLITKEIPKRFDIALLRSKFDDLDCDIAILLESSFNNPKTAFEKNVVKDFKEISL